MADEVQFKVKNVSDNGIIKVTRYLADGLEDTDFGTREICKDPDKWEAIDLFDPRFSLKITAPVDSTDFRNCFIKIRSDTDVKVEFSRSLNYWKMGIVYNKLEPFAPTTVNVTVGDENP